MTAYATVGALVASRHPGNVIGWILSALALVIGITVFAGALAQHSALHQARPDAFVKTAAWFDNWSWVPQVFVPATFVLLLFPNGRLPSRGWRVVAWSAGLATAAISWAIAFDPGPLSAHPSVVNPYAVGRSAAKAGALLGVPVIALSIAAAVASVVVRFRRADETERRQIKVLVYAGCFLLGTFGLGQGLVAPLVSHGLANLVSLLGVLGVAVGIGIAILRYRLYEIDVVIKRTLVYGALTALLAGAYLGLVLLFQLAFSPVTQGNGLAVAFSTLAVAALFGPARRRIQVLVDRRFYRQKYDADRTLDGFAAHLRVEIDLDTLAAELRAVVAETLQPAHISLWLRHDGVSVTPAATTARRSPKPTTTTCTCSRGPLAPSASYHRSHLPPFPLCRALWGIGGNGLRGRPVYVGKGKKAKMGMIQVYTTEWCGYCVRAKALLDGKQLAYEEISLDDDPQFRRKLMELTGSWTVPQILIDGDPIGGYAELWRLDKTGQLDERVAA